jgi:hypothetical protein
MDSSFQTTTAHAFSNRSKTACPSGDACEFERKIETVAVVSEKNK